MNLESQIDIIICVYISAICWLAVFNPSFDDTLMQRIGLGGMAIGSMALAWWLFRVGTTPAPITWCLWSAAIFSGATAHKIRKKIINGTYTPSLHHK